jgi:hypothetical protein
MILFDLKCANEHQFEAWFKDSETFALQVEGKEIACPVCGDGDVAKALMAPRIGKGKGKEEISAKVAEHAQRYAAFAKELRRHVEENCDYVGKEFPEEARKIHYGETEARGIYGEASAEDAAALDDEGIEVQRIPWAPQEDA